jgi:hypothetical protein
LLVYANIWYVTLMFEYQSFLSYQIQEENNVARVSRNWLTWIYYINRSNVLFWSLFSCDICHYIEMAKIFYFNILIFYNNFLLQFYSLHFAIQNITITHEKFDLRHFVSVAIFNFELFFFSSYDKKRSVWYYFFSHEFIVYFYQFILIIFLPQF